MAVAGTPIKFTVVTDDGKTSSGIPLGKIGRPGSLLCVATSKGEVCGRVPALERGPSSPSVIGKAFHQAIGKSVSQTGTHHARATINAGELATIGAVAIGTHYWNKSRSAPSQGGWRIGEIGLGALAAAGSGLGTPLGRVAAGVVIGGVIGSIAGNTPNTTTGARVDALQTLAAQAPQIQPGSAVRVHVRVR